MSPTSVTVIYTTLLLRALAAPIPSPAQQNVKGIESAVLSATHDSSYELAHPIGRGTGTQPVESRPEQLPGTLTVRAPEEQANGDGDAKEQENGDKQEDNDNDGASEPIEAGPARSMAVFGFSTGICSVM